MKTYNLDLLSWTFPSLTHHAHIYIKEYSTDEKGHILLTPECVSYQELQYQADRLIKELEEIKRKAKKRFIL